MNQYVMSQLPGGVECYGEQDRYLKTLEVKDFILVAIDDELLTVDDSPVITLTVPTGAEYAKLTNHGSATLYITTSGTTPVASSKTGFAVANGATVYIYGEAMAALKMVTAAASSATVYVEYFRS